MTKRVRVLVADDSMTIRESFARWIRADRTLELVGQACDGQEAVDLALELRPDVITMDAQMPRKDGFDAITEIMSRAPSRILAVCAVSADDSANLSMRAMQAGALELIAKPRTPSESTSFGDRLLRAIRLMAEIPVITQRKKGDLRPPAHVSGRSIDAIGLAASTGGPPALTSLLGTLPASFPAPILIAQHMAVGFGAGLARWLQQCTSLKVVVARNGEPVAPGRVYVPLDGCDIEMGARGVLSVRASSGGHCPNADRLFSSLARACGARACGVVLTGMGEDGARGLLEIRRAGGPTFAQNEATCVVFGMPEAAVRLGAAENLVPLGELGRLLRELCTPSNSDKTSGAKR
ncbi:MAG: chemotaxis protein CheB [Myxococcaceae bacterium]